MTVGNFKPLRFGIRIRIILLSLHYVQQNDKQHPCINIYKYIKKRKKKLYTQKPFFKKKKKKKQIMAVVQVLKKIYNQKDNYVQNRH